MTLRASRWAAAILAAASCATAAQPPLKALIVDGQNNHAWAKTTPVMKEILEASGRFRVDVATSPPRGKPLDGFAPNFAAYDVVVSNYNGAEWPAATKDAFVRYIAGGGGLVVVHAADNAFPKWPEYNEMIGLGGWGGRNEKSGPYLYWKDGKPVRDTSPGRGGHHGARTPYVVTHRNTDHPITRGLPTRWMHCADELYCKLRGPAKNITVLATAFSDARTGGSGREELALFTIAYGKGRIFHTVLGHGPEQMRCVGFIVTLQRGTEWAATGKVTQTAVPKDFPTPEKPSVRSGPIATPAAARGPAGPEGPVVDEATWAAAAKYTPGAGRAPLSAVEAAVRGASPAVRAAVEGRLLKLLADRATTPAAKQWACRVLRRIGTARSVPALEKLLADEKLSHMARFALQHLPGPEATAALRRALGSLTGNLRIGVIGSLAQRRDAGAVPQLARLAGAGDPATAAAAINALGTIGGPEATDVLAALRAPAVLRRQRDDALLRCADSLLAAGRKDRAAAIYRKMLAPANPTMIRVAALRGVTLTGGAEAVGILLEMLKDPNVTLQRAAGKFLGEVPGAEAAKALAAALPSLPAAAQVMVLNTLRTRGDRASAAAAEKCLAADDEAVRVAAVEALGALGGPGHVPALVKVLAAGGAPGNAAQAALVRLRGAPVGAALAKLARGPAAPVLRAKAIDILLARREAGAMDALFAACTDADADVRRAAFKAIGLMAGEKELPRLVGMLIDPANAARRGEIERALGSVVARVPNPDAGAAVVVRALPSARGEAKANLLAVLPRLGGARALAAAREALGSSDPAVRKAAISALSDWPDSAPMADLLRIARSDPSQVNQVLALRGYIKMLTAPANRSSAETTRLLAEALEIARRPDEKKAVLAALPKVPCEQSLALARRLTADPQLAGEASLAAQKIKAALAKQEMTATAFPVGDGPKNALDGNPKTRWSTGRPMRPGDWFAVQLGREVRIASITLDTRGSAGDYPRGWELYVSFDGKTWGKPVASGKGTGPITKITLEQPVPARHFKIVQTGSTPNLHWSIHTLKIDVK